ncbi:MAG: DMT family transporter [Candidatus Puniceispirillaceae bacterium]
MANQSRTERPRSPAPSRADNIRGAMFMLAGMFVFAAVDAQAKYLTEFMPAMQIVWARQLALCFGVILLIGFRGRAVLRTSHPVLQVVRGVMAASSATLFIIGLNFVALADAVSVTFIAPLVVTMLGAVLLGERVGLHRWTATIIGFLGTLVVIRPGFESFHPGLLLPLTAAILFAGRQIVSRHIGHRDRTATTVAYTALTATLLLTLTLPFVWVEIDPRLLPVLLLMSLMAALGEFLVIRALEIGLAVFVSPLHYTIIIWASIYGYLLFGQFPDGWTWAGSAIIIASGLYVMHRERRAAARAQG